MVLIVAVVFLVVFLMGATGMWVFGRDGHHIGWSFLIVFWLIGSVYSIAASSMA